MIRLGDVYCPDVLNSASIGELSEWLYGIEQMRDNPGFAFIKEMLRRSGVKACSYSVSLFMDHKELDGAEAAGAADMLSFMGSDAFLEDTIEMIEGRLDELRRQDQ